jgi:hypothetical protein
VGCNPTTAAALRAASNSYFTKRFITWANFAPVIKTMYDKDTCVPSRANPRSTRSEWPRQARRKVMGGRYGAPRLVGSSRRRPASRRGYCKGCHRHHPAQISEPRAIFSTRSRFRRLPGRTSSPASFSCFTRRVIPAHVSPLTRYDQRTTAVWAVHRNHILNPTLKGRTPARRRPRENPCPRP